MVKPKTFIEKLNWSDLVGYLDGWIPKLSLSVPVLGYLILFNDQVSEYFAFYVLANETAQDGMSGVERLRFIYFGLIFLGIGNLLYRIRRPYHFRYGTTVAEHQKTCLEAFTFNDYKDMHDWLLDFSSPNGRRNYASAEWEAFSLAAENPYLENEITSQSVGHNWSWDEAKKRYGGLLRDMLIDQFHHESYSRKKTLVACVSLSTIGYLFLALPSLDLFMKVVFTVF